jgi:hypothetical protein
MAHLLEQLPGEGGARAVTANRVHGILVQAVQLVRNFLRGGHRHVFPRHSHEDFILANTKNVLLTYVNNK